MRATEDVAAHAPILRGGAERPRAGGGARQEGAALQPTGGTNTIWVWMTIEFV